MSEERAASIFKTEKSSVEKSDSYKSLWKGRPVGGLRRSNDTKQSQLYSDSWWSVGAGREGGG
jgi:hypothetical protein